MSQRWQQGTCFAGDLHLKRRSKGINEKKKAWKKS
jgi:hypothetical protein